MTRSVECGCLVRRLDVGIQDVGLAPKRVDLVVFSQRASFPESESPRELRCTVVPVVGGPMSGSFSHRHCPLVCYRCTLTLLL